MNAQWYLKIRLYGIELQNSLGNTNWGSRRFQRLAVLATAYNTMNLLTNIFLLTHQLGTASSLRVIDNGLGYHVLGNVVDFAVLADDRKASLPSQVQQILRLDSHCQASSADNACLLWPFLPRELYTSTKAKS